MSSEITSSKDVKDSIRRISPELLIKKYFQQLTSGCGRKSCSNKKCVSGGFVAMNCEEAAVMALKCIIEKAQICEDQADPITSSDQVLSYSYIKKLIEFCDNGNFLPLLHILGKAFSSPDLMNKSFIVTKNIIPNSPESIIPLDYNEVIDFYNLLLQLELESIENVIINGIIALASSFEIKLKTNTLFDKTDLNQFVIILLNPNLHSPEYFECALPNILQALVSLPVNLQAILANYLSKLSSSSLKKILDVFQQLITVRILTGPHATNGTYVNDDINITNSIKMIKIIYYASILGGDMEKTLKYSHSAVKKSSQDIVEPSRAGLPKDTFVMLEDVLEVDLSRCRKPLIPYDDFINDCLNDAIEMSVDYSNFKNGSDKFSFLHFPFVLKTSTKTLGLFYDNRVRMYSERRITLLTGLLQGHIPSPYLKLVVRRDHLIQDSLVGLEMVAQDEPEDFKKQFFVEFEGEQGIDEGGVSKEFFQLIIEELFNPDFGMFTLNETTRTYWFHPTSFEAASQFMLIGVLFGIAIYNSIILDVRFPAVLYRKLLGYSGKFEDLSSSHPEIFFSLNQLLSYNGNIKEDIMASFQISYSDMFGSTVSHELIEGGKDIEVTNQNREEYAALYADFILNTSVKQQFDAFKKGFDIVTSHSILKKIFRPDELELLVCGSQIYDINELENATEYDGGYSKDTPVIRYFWQVIHEMSSDQAKQFLNFTTGSDRVPVGGLSKLKLIIAKNGEDSDRLPTAHTCFNVLLLPKYSSIDKLRERLLKAISNAKGFGLM
ncbi:ubiquitin-protein ligase E3A isoform X3 [Hydra vulgaris]|uniref:HECT-type E3 ubiquitin transferase n=2 Tax=Hydra vulgaris TaxID=6087 RepID=A0ABM4D4W1_HYDVU